MLKYKKIVVTGGTGRFGRCLKESNSKYKMLFPNKSELNILKTNSIKKYLKKNRPFCLVHLAGLSRPMSLHDKNISKSIDLNIIGTSNIVKICSTLNIKLIYFSTSYVYPGTRGNYNEKDALFPVNNYAWSKLGGESAVQMYKNSLILRICMTEKPFVHKSAFCDVLTNFIYHKDLLKIFLKLINKKGIINVGGPTQTVYNFVKKENPKIKKSYAKKIRGLNFPLNSSMNLKKLKKNLK
tara:strand:- start:534 stop:1250 length:717 start_codon:yes stop_codon:yes gene_type:complete